MAFTYDPTTDAGRVRLLSTDADSAAPVFTDAEIDTFLALAPGGDIRMAAAQALDTIASSESLIQKKIKLLDLNTDGPAVAADLRAAAAELRRQYREDDGNFDWAEQVTSPALWRERILDDARRAGV